MNSNCKLFSVKFSFLYTFVTINKIIVYKEQGISVNFNCRTFFFFAHIFFSMHLFPSTQIDRHRVCRPTALPTDLGIISKFFPKIVVRFFRDHCILRTENSLSGAFGRIVHGHRVFGQIEIRTDAGLEKYDNIVFTE